jgi:hypothetical protein
MLLKTAQKASEISVNFFTLFHLDELGSLTYFSSESGASGFYRKSVGLLRRGISHVTRPLPTNHNTEKS